MLSLVFKNYYSGASDQLKLTPKRMNVRNVQNEGFIKDNSSSVIDRNSLLFMGTSALLYGMFI